VTVFPVPEIVPPLAVHVTAVLLLLDTFAVNVVFAFGANAVLVGVMLTATAAVEVTVTVADAFLVESATLVAVTV
jgi:hypothetical protein